MASATTKEIGGRTFVFGMLPAMEAVKVARLLARALGPVLQSVVGISAAKGDEPSLAAALAPAIEGVSAALSEDELTGLVARMLTTVSVGTPPEPARPVHADRDFGGRPRELWVVVVEALKVNFSDFFPASPSTSNPPEASKLPR